MINGTWLWVVFFPFFLAHQELAGALHATRYVKVLDYIMYVLTLRQLANYIDDRKAGVCLAAHLVTAVV